MGSVLARRNKYHARTTVIDGRRFASRAEARRYQELLLLERAGEISDLKCQVPIPLFTATDAGVRVPVLLGKRTATYYADFSYRDARGNYRLEDVKGYDLALGRLKRAIVKASTGLTVEIIRMPAKTARQARFMRACAHGYKPTKAKCPPQVVAREFSHTRKVPKKR